MSDSGYVIRNYRPGDRARVRELCFETGYKGESAEWYYSDRESFADMFTGYFTDHEPENSWVIERIADGVVVGYMLGSRDSRLGPEPAAIALKHAFLRGLLFRPGTAPFLFRAIADIVRDGGVHKPKVDLDRYPAHAHINLLPEARTGGLGGTLVRMFLNRLRELGVPGMHVEMMEENRGAIGIAEHLGFKKIGEPFPLPGIRSKEGGRLHGRVLLIDLREEPRALIDKPVSTRAPA